MKASLSYNHHFYKKKDKLYLVFDFKDDDGNRKKKWVSMGLQSGCSEKTQRAREKELIDEFNAEFLSGNVTKVEKKVEPSVAVLPATSNGTTDLEFGDFLLKWLERSKSKIAFNSYVGYKGVVTRIKAYFDERYPHLLLRDLTASQLQDFYDEKIESGMSGNTVKHYHANIHKALKYAVKMDQLNINVADKVDLPKVEKFEANFYTKEELDVLFQVFKGDRIELVVYIAAYYGLRKSEIIGLKWDSIDFEAGTITVRRKVSSTYGTGKEVIRVDNELKTKASERTFPLIPKIEEMLKERKILEDYYSKLLGKDFDREYDGFVCRDNFGKLITPNFVTDHFKRVIKRNNLKKIRFHDLRHSCASLLLAKGASMKAIQDWLGHSTFNVTANYYSHLDPRTKEKSAEMITEIFCGESTTDKQDKDNGDEKNRKPSN